MAKAIGYLRVSTDEQAESGLGLEAQRAAVLETARGLRLEVSVWERDEGVSGAAELEKRPGLLAAVEQLKAGDVLVVAKRDRLARDPIVTAMVERLAARKGARLVSAAGECSDGDDPTSVLMRRIVDAFGEYERLLIGARTKAALAAKKARGECVGKVPFGWDLDEDGKSLVKNQLEQAAIEVILEERERQEFRAIAAELERQNSPEERQDVLGAHIYRTHRRKGARLNETKVFEEAQQLAAKVRSTAAASPGSSRQVLDDFVQSRTRIPWALVAIAAGIASTVLGSLVGGAVGALLARSGAPNPIRDHMQDLVRLHGADNAKKIVERAILIIEDKDPEDDDGNTGFPGRRP